MPLHKALLALWLAAGTGAKRAENVVMLLADDLGWADVSVPPHKKAALWVTETPHLERMAREGLTLTGYRNAASVCSPSRLAIATGVFPWRYRLSGLLKDGFRGLPARRRRRGPAKCGLRDGSFWQVAPRRRARARADRAAGRCHRHGPPGPNEHGYDVHLDQVEASVRDPPVCCSCCAPNPGTTRRTSTPSTGTRLRAAAPVACVGTCTAARASGGMFPPGHSEPAPRRWTSRSGRRTRRWRGSAGKTTLLCRRLVQRPISRRAHRAVLRCQGRRATGRARLPMARRRRRQILPSDDSVVRALDAGVGRFITSWTVRRWRCSRQTTGRGGRGHARPFGGASGRPTKAGPQYLHLLDAGHDPANNARTCLLMEPTSMRLS